MHGLRKPQKGHEQETQFAREGASWQHHGHWTAMPDPATMASDTQLRSQARIWSHMTARRALNPRDNSITSDQNCSKQLLFPMYSSGILDMRSCLLLARALVANTMYRSVSFLTSSGSGVFSSITSVNVAVYPSLMSWCTLKRPGVSLPHAPLWPS